MSRFRRDASVGPGLKRLVVLLALADAGLLALAISRGGQAIADGAGSITNGWLVAAGIVATLALCAAAPLARLPPRLTARAQAAALGGQALHAGGHLFAWYYRLWFYDDLLHAGLTFAVALLAEEAFRSRGFALQQRLRPARFGLVVWLAAVAAAGAWEIFEFAVDSVAGTREQDDLRDTMLDMIDGALGGLAAAALAAWRARRDRRAKALGDARSPELLD